MIAVGGETLSDDEAVDAFVAAQAGAVAAAPPAGAGAAARPARAPRAAERDDAGRITASPAARKRARELGIDLAAVTATGAGRPDHQRRRRAGRGRRRRRTAAREDWLAISAACGSTCSRPGSPGAPAVVFLHGIGGSSASWQARRRDVRRFAIA